MYLSSAASTVVRLKTRLWKANRESLSPVSVKKLKKAETGTTTLLWNDVSKLGDLSDDAFYLFNYK